MTIRVFDLAGAVALAAFAAVVWTDRAVLVTSRRTLGVAASEAELADGFREGSAWYALRLGDQPAGHARIDRRRLGDGLQIDVTAALRMVALGAPRDVGLRMSTYTDRSLRLQRFEVALTSDLLDVNARGVFTDRLLELDVTTAGLERRTRIPLEGPPIADAGVATRLLRERPRPGDRFDIPTFDPFGLAPRTVPVEYLGIERIAALDGMLRCHHLRQHFEGQAMDLWVNDLGEVVRQQLPFGLTLERTTEAEATSAAGGPAAEAVDLGAALSQLAGASP